MKSIIKILVVIQVVVLLAVAYNSITKIQQLAVERVNHVNSIANM